MLRRDNRGEDTLYSYTLYRVWSGGQEEGFSVIPFATRPIAYTPCKDDKVAGERDVGRASMARALLYIPEDGRRRRG